MRSRRVVDSFDDELVHLEIAEHGNEQDEGNGDPEFGFEHVFLTA